MRRAAPVLEYPILALYRRILRAHEHFLPLEQRQLGDAYVKLEFRQHRGASSSFLAQFERQWRDYLMLVRRPADGRIGRNLTPEEVAALNDDQKLQILKLREQAAGPPKVEP